MRWDGTMDQDSTKAKEKGGRGTFLLLRRGSPCGLRSQSELEPWDLTCLAWYV